MKRVLIISLAYFPHVGGAEVAVKEITDRIQDIEFHMVTLRFSRAEAAEEKIGNILVHRIEYGSGRLAKAWFQIGAVFAAAKLHRKYHYDAVWAIMAHSAGVPAGLFKTFHRNVGYALTLQEGDPPEHIERIMRPFGPLFKRAFTLADSIQTISHFLAAWAKRSGAKVEPVVIPNGVNAAHFMGEPIVHEDTVLVTTSRLVKKNAVDDVIRALSMLPESVRFDIYGVGPEEPVLRSLAVKLRVVKRVRFMGHVAHAELPRALHGADIFIRPSRSEGMGNSFIEAMAAGLPVIATQEGGIADFLYDAKRNPERPTTGWAVDKDAPLQIAEAVKDILANPEKVRAVTATAKAMVVADYDWNLIAKRMRTEVFDPTIGSN